MPDVASFEPGAPCWLDLVAIDPEIARDFYTALFGWQISAGHATETSYLVARQDGRAVAGIRAATSEGPPPGWTVYFSCTETADLSQRIRAGGGHLVTAAASEGDDGVALTFRDPQGAVAGGWRPGRVAGARRIGEPATWLGSELITSDLAAAVAFYTAVLPITASEDYGPDRVTLSAGQFAFGTIVESAAQAPRWRPLFRAADITRTADIARKAGGRIRPNHSDSDSGRAALIIDPQGGQCLIGGPPS
jgi:predicted enzyme related to lactoylglutathione lyase